MIAAPETWKITQQIHFETPIQSGQSRTLSGNLNLHIHTATATAESISISNLLTKSLARIA